MSWPSPKSASTTPPVYTDSDLSNKRKAFACDSCHRKKIKCDVETPCNWCRHHNLQCTFNRARRPPNQNKKRKKGDLSKNEDRLVERMERLERALIQTLADRKRNSDDVEAPVPAQVEPSSDTSKAPHEPASVSSNGKLHFAGYNFATVSSFSGIPFFSPDGQDWIRSRTGESITLDDIFPNGPPWLNHKTFFTEPETGRKSLPPRAVVDKCLEIYFSSFAHRVFPFIDRSLFHGTLDAAYQDSESASSRMCVFSFLVFMSDLPPQFTIIPESDRPGYEFEAERLIRMVIREAVTVDGLQAIIMLAITHMCKANLGSVDMFLAIAARMVFALGGNRKPTANESHIRTLFWLCYVVDKDLSLRTGRPPHLNDDQCDLTLPKPYIDELHNMNSDSTSCEVLDRFPGDLRLSMIKSKTYNQLYSSLALQKSNAELLRNVRELDEELVRWKTAFPEPYRQNFMSGKRPGARDSMTSVMLSLEYYHCTTMIHQAVSRCSGWHGNQNNMEGVSSSLALCVEASRSSLLHLKISHNSIPEGCYWVIIFYPICSLLTLFCNILLDPLHERAKEDVAIINEASEFLGQALTHSSDSDAIIHSAVLRRFLNELGRLGQRAIDSS